MDNSVSELEGKNPVENNGLPNHGTNDLLNSNQNQTIDQPMAINMQTNIVSNSSEVPPVVTQPSVNEVGPNTVNVSTSTSTNVIEPVQEIATENVTSQTPVTPSVIETVSEPINSLPQTSNDVIEPVQEIATENVTSQTPVTPSVIETVSEPINSLPQTSNDVIEPVQEIISENVTPQTPVTPSVIETVSEPINSLPQTSNDVIEPVQEIISENVTSQTPVTPIVSETVSEPINSLPQTSNDVIEPVQEIATENVTPQTPVAPSVIETVSEPINSLPQTSNDVIEPVQGVVSGNVTSQTPVAPAVTGMVSEPLNPLPPTLNNVVPQNLQGNNFTNVNTLSNVNQIGLPTSNVVNFFGGSIPTANMSINNQMNDQPINGLQPAFNPFQNNPTNIPQSNIENTPNQINDDLSNNSEIKNNSNNSFVPQNNFVPVSQNNNSIGNNKNKESAIVESNPNESNTNKKDSLSMKTQIIYTIIGILLIVGVGFGVAYIVNSEIKLVCLRSTGSKFVVKFDENGIKSATLNGKDVSSSDLKDYQTIFSKEFLDAKRQDEEYIESFKRIVKEYEESNGGSCE